MALVVFDRVQETTATTGTGTITLGGAVTGYQSFAVVGDGNTTFYCITNNAQWEVGIGTYTSSGTTLSRDTILSNSNSNASPITLSGNSVVFVTYPAGKSVNLNASGNVTALGTVSSGTWQGSTIGVAYGGTGVTSSSGANSVVLRDSNANVIFNNFIAGFTAVTAAAGTTVLTVASTRTQVLVGSTTQTIQLPDATTLQLGHSFIFVNNSSGVLTITNNAGATIDLVPAGGAAQLGATSIATNAGTWGIYSFLPGTYNFSTPTADFGNADITNAVWNGTTIGSAYGGTGLTTFAAADNALYSTGATTLTAGTLPVAAGGTGATSLSGANIAVTNVTNTFTANQVVSVTDNSNAALRITQIGTGDALLVEDSTNPDATPFVIDATGSVVAGYTSALSNYFFGSALRIPKVQVQGVSVAFASQSITNWASGTTGTGAPHLIFAKSKSDTVGTQTALNGADQYLGVLQFNGDDGTSFIPGAWIRSATDGTPGTNDMPGRLEFATTADGASSPTERMRINATGEVGIGTTAAGIQLSINAGDNNAIQTTQTGLTALQMVSSDASASGINIQYYKDSASPLASDSIALVRSFGNSSTGVQREYSRITTLATVVTNGSEDGELRLSTIDDGDLFSSMRLLNSAQAFIPAVYTSTTASAANVFVASSGLMSRSTSSIQYKTNVEDLAQPNSANIYNMRPVWYRSTCTDDNKDWSWYGLIAEEVAELDPRLVHWGYANDQYDITYIENDGQKEKVKTLKEDAVLQPEGVQYDRLTVLLIQEMKVLKAKVDSLEAEVQTLKNK